MLYGAYSPLFEVKKQGNSFDPDLFKVYAATPIVSKYSSVLLISKIDFIPSFKKKRINNFRNLLKKKIFSSEYLN